MKGTGRLLGGACAAFVISAFLFPAQLFAHGYTEYQNHRIWSLRLEARSHALQEAKVSCGWAPTTPASFADEFPFDENVLKPRLLLAIIAMIRLDQNARAISVALHDKKSVADRRTQEVDSFNLGLLRGIISKGGFPTIEEIGYSGVNAMLIMVAHADKDLTFQRNTLNEMDARVAEGKLPPMFPAILRSIRPQIGGATPAPEKRLSTDQSRDYGSSRECYTSKYKAVFNLYIRNHYSTIYR